MVWWGYKAMGKAVTVGARSGVHVGDSVASKLALHSAGGAARRGYLAPGDPTPPPSATTDYLDYRGVASSQEAQNLDGGQFPVGAFSDLRAGKFRGAIGLPGQVINRHAVVVPAGSGKTYSLIIPWIYAALTANWSVFAVDVEGDLRGVFLDFKGAQARALLARGCRSGISRTRAARCRGRGSPNWHDEARVDAAITAPALAPTGAGDERSVLLPARLPARSAAC